MALGTTNISLSAVKTLLGASNYSLFDIGHDDAGLINKWSKYKPIAAPGAGTTEPTIWPTGATNIGSGHKYGLNLPTNWDYLHPQGGSPGGSPDEPVRLGDFRGYEHDTNLAFPSLHALEGLNPVQNLHPVNGPVTIDWYFYAYDDASDVIIRPTDYGFQDYYFGIKIWGDNVPTSYRTYAQVHDVPDTGTLYAISAVATISGFQDLPHGYGTYNYSLFISEDPSAYTDHYEWTVAATFESGNTIITLPEEGDYMATGTFDVSKYIYFDNPDPTWGTTVYGSGNSITIHIGAYPTGITVTHVPDNGLTGWTVLDQMSDPLVEDAELTSGDHIVIYPNDENNSGTNKTESIQFELTLDPTVTGQIDLVQYHRDAPTDPPDWVTIVASLDGGAHMDLGTDTVTGATAYVWTVRPIWNGSSWVNGTATDDNDPDHRVTLASATTSKVYDVLAWYSLTTEADGVTFYADSAGANGGGTGPYTVTEDSCEFWSS